MSAYDGSALVELRRYRLRPGRRDELVALFERELVEPQEAVGLRVLAQFCDEEQPDHFVWLRGFASTDPEARGRALAAFYRGPVWAAHGAAANATMIDSDDVLLLRPARPDTGPSLVPRDAFSSGPGVVSATTCLLDRPLDADALDAVLVLLLDASAPLAVLVTATIPNAFPALPVRGEHALVWLEGHTDPAAAQEHERARSGRPGWADGVPVPLRGRLRAPRERAFLRPTRGSRRLGVMSAAR